MMKTLREKIKRLILDMDDIRDKVKCIIGYVAFFIFIAGVMSHGLINEMDDSIVAVTIAIIWALVSTVILWDMLTNHPIIKD